MKSTLNEAENVVHVHMIIMQVWRQKVRSAHELANNLLLIAKLVE